MAAVVSMTMQEDDMTSQKAVEYIAQLECENRHLREILHFTQSGVLDSANTPSDSTQTESDPTHPSSHTSQLHSMFSESLPRRQRRQIPFAQHEEEEKGQYVATPINSGQATPIATPTSREAVFPGPVLQEACDKLTGSRQNIV